MGVIAKQLRTFAVYIDGNSYVGKVEAKDLPALTIKTDDLQAGGMDMPIKQDMGMEALEGSITFLELDKEVAKRLGKKTPLTIRGSQEGPNGSEAIIVEMTANFRSREGLNLKATERAKPKYSYDASYYKETIAGEVVTEIDPVNHIRIIGGVDQLAERRKNLNL